MVCAYVDSAEMTTACLLNPPLHPPMYLFPHPQLHCEEEEGCPERLKLADLEEGDELVGWWELMGVS